MTNGMTFDNIPSAGFIVSGLTIEQLARKFAERGEAVDLMRALCEVMDCTLRVDPLVEEYPQLVLSRN